MSGERLQDHWSSGLHIYSKPVMHNGKYDIAFPKQLETQNLVMVNINFGHLYFALFPRQFKIAGCPS